VEILETLDLGPVRVTIRRATASDVPAIVSLLAADQLGATRDGGLGAALFGWAINEARRRQCALVQLTTDKSRISAHRFYERLGFAATHEGMKLIL